MTRDLDKLQALSDMQKTAEEVIAKAHALKAEAEALQITIALTIQDCGMSDSRVEMIDQDTKHLKNQIQRLYRAQKRIRKTWQNMRRAEHVDN